MPAIACYKLDNHTPKIIQALIDNNWTFGRQKITMETEFRQYIYLWDDKSVCHSSFESDQSLCTKDVTIDDLLKIIKKTSYHIENGMIRFTRTISLYELHIINKKLNGSNYE